MLTFRKLSQALAHFRKFGFAVFCSIFRKVLHFRKVLQDFANWLSQDFLPGFVMGTLLMTSSWPPQNCGYCPPARLQAVWVCRLAYSVTGRANGRVRSLRSTIPWLAAKFLNKASIPWLRQNRSWTTTIRHKKHKLNKFNTQKLSQNIYCQSMMIQSLNIAAFFPLFASQSMAFTCLLEKIIASFSTEILTFYHLINHSIVSIQLLWA